MTTRKHYLCVPKQYTDGLLYMAKVLPQSRDLRCWFPTTKHGTACNDARCRNVSSDDLMHLSLCGETQVGSEFERFQTHACLMCGADLLNLPVTRPPDSAWELDGFPRTVRDRKCVASEFPAQETKPNQPHFIENIHHMGDNRVRTAMWRSSMPFVSISGESVIEFAVASGQPHGNTRSSCQRPRRGQFQAPPEIILLSALCLPEILESRRFSLR